MCVRRHISTRGGVLLEKVEGRRERGTRKQVGRDTMLAGRLGYHLGWDHVLTDTLGWAGLGWAGLGWAELGWAGLGWAGLGWAGLGWAPV